ncbi:MAG: hypothetical protein ACOYLR_11680, partial [Chlorobium sp.]
MKLQFSNLQSVCFRVVLVPFRWFTYLSWNARAPARHAVSRHWSPLQSMPTQENSEKMCIVSGLH